MDRVGVPRRHVDNFRAFRESYPVMEAAKWPVRGFLVFGGTAGSGKSFGAAYVVREYLESRAVDWLDRGAWINAERAADSVMWRSAKDVIDDGEAYARSASVTLLVMDDLGREEETKTARSALCSVVSKRYDAKLATVVTTELSMAGLRKRYGRYLTDRLTEDIGHGGGIIDCGDVSMRMGVRSVEPS
jgi:DNA replication protein DnaC